eukprot:13022-Rhodomonas_salina.2
MVVRRYLASAAYGAMQSLVLMHDMLLRQYFAFAYIWTLGGNLHDDSLEKFGNFARQLLSEVSSAISLRTCYAYGATGRAVLTWRMVLRDVQYWPSVCCYAVTTRCA